MVSCQNADKSITNRLKSSTKTLLRLNNIEGLFKLRGVRQQAFQDGGIACDLNLSCLLTGHQGKQLEPLAGDRCLRICTVFARISQQYAILTGDVELLVLICHVQIQSKVIVLRSIAIRQDRDIIQQHGNRHRPHTVGEAVRCAGAAGQIATPQFGCTHQVDIAPSAGLRLIAQLFERVCAKIARLLVGDIRLKLRVGIS